MQTTVKLANSIEGILFGQHVIVISGQWKPSFYTYFCYFHSNAHTHTFTVHFKFIISLYLFLPRTHFSGFK